MSTRSLTPSALARTLMLSAAAMTNRLDPDNRRSILVSLTPTGRELVDAAVTDHVANERALLWVLDPADRQRLDQLLRRLLAGVEGTGRA